jgi:hypothetical protein
LRQLTIFTSVQGSSHDISKFKQNKRLLHSLKGGYEINLQSKLVTRKTSYKKQRKKKDSLPSRGRAGVSAPHEREGALGVVSSSAHCRRPCVPSTSPRAAVRFRPPPVVSLPPRFVALTLHPASRGSQRWEGCGGSPSSVGGRGSCPHGRSLPPVVVAPLWLPPGTTPRAVARGRCSGCCWSWSSPCRGRLGPAHGRAPPHSHPTSRGSWQWWGWVRGRESLSSILFLLVERKKETRKKTYLWPRRRRRRLLGLFLVLRRGRPIRCPPRPLPGGCWVVVWSFSIVKVCT